MTFVSVTGRISRAVGLFAVAVMALPAAHTAHAAIPYEIRYETGDPAPGGGTFMSLGAPQIDANGGVAFGGSTAVLYTSGAGIWAPTASAPLGVIAKVGMNLSANGVSGFSFNPAGQLTFAAETGLWAYDKTNGARTLMQKDAVAPGTGGALFREVFGGGFSFVSSPVISPSGQVVFQAPLKLATGSPSVTEANDFGFWSAPAGSNGATVNVLREGPAPGLAGQNWNIFDFPASVRVNGLGHTVVHLAYGTGFSNAGTWRSTTPGGAWTLLASNGATYASVAPPSLNEAGDVAFYANLAGSNAPSIRVRREASGVTQEVTRAGLAAPGAGGNFVNFYDPLISGDGSTFFIANVSGGAGTGLWRAEPNNVITTIGISKQDAPGLAGYKWMFSGIDTLATNDDGDLLFSSGVTNDPSSPVVSQQALWLYDSETDLISYAMAWGLPLEGDGRIVDRFNLRGGRTNNQDGVGSSLNDAGQFAVHVEFKDGSEAIMVYGVPEPSAALLTLGGVAITAMRRRGRRLAR